jgi:hypothetical protein
MPGMSGPDLQRELKLRGQEIPIVFITAQKDEACVHVCSSRVPWSVGVAIGPDQASLLVADDVADALGRIERTRLSEVFPC